ncbi:MAG: hypothetical protein WBQ08_17580 [Candidatus Sulfotelmatobacter sp.]
MRKVFRVASEPGVCFVACLLGVCLILGGCGPKKPVPASPTPPPAPIRSQAPPDTAETIEHCVVVKQENANTVTCSCLAVSTRIDSKTGHTTLVCKKMKEEK